MRRVTLLTAIVVIAVAFLTSSSQAGIVGSKHDFGQAAYASWSGGQICKPCHIPHAAVLKDAEGRDIETPLWNHTLPANSYDMLIGGVKKKDAVDENSILCLSCHDGSLALDAFGGGGKGTSGPIGANAANLGTDLSNDHPIGAAAIWPTGASYMVDPALRAAQGIMPLRPMKDGTLAVGCTSCHEPHNRKNQANLLWSTNGSGTTVDGRTVNGSLLCLNCHKK